jgi:hypothetical protein
MTNVHGSGTFVSLDGEDVSPFTNSTTFGDGSDVHETTTYGRSRKTYFAGLGDGKITIGGFYDNGATGPRAVIKPLMAAGDPVEFIYRPEGTGAGLPQSKVDVVISSFNESSPVGDMVTWTCELQMTDDLDESDQ